jgi:5-methylcytosine-specific restriction endonuclease McrA
MMTNDARDLATRLSELLRREHHAMADFLVALADFDRRRLWVDLGHASLFSFLHRELGLSKGAAHYRKVAAELVQRFPQVVEPLREGQLCITTIVELAKVMTVENAVEVLPRFFHRSKSEAMAIAAEIRPDEAPPRRAVVTAARAAASALLAPPPSAAEASAPSNPTSTPTASSRVQPAEQVDAKVPDAAPRAPISRERATVLPLTADLRRLSVTVSKRLLDKLDAARAALSHSHPGASVEDILEVGLDLVLERHAKRRGLVKTPRKTPRPAKPNHVPAHVKAAVWKRDGGKCQWPLESGGICGSTLRVELDHVRAKALGGKATVDDMRCLCKPHNDLAARQAFGDAFMDQFTRGLRRSREAAVAAPSAPPP